MTTGIGLELVYSFVMHFSSTTLLLSPWLTLTVRVFLLLSNDPFLYIYHCSNIVKLFVFFLTLAALKKARAVVLEDLNEETQTASVSNARQGRNEKKGMILPFKPLTMTFHNVNYYVDMPKVRFTFIVCISPIWLQNLRLYF